MSTEELVRAVRNPTEQALTVLNLNGIQTKRPENTGKADGHKNVSGGSEIIFW